VGGAAVTGVVEGVRHLQPAKFWVHSNRQIQAQKMHSNFCWLSLANLFFLKKTTKMAYDTQYLKKYLQH